MGLRKLKPRGIAAIATTAVVVTIFCLLIAVIPGGNSAAQAGPAPGGSGPAVGTTDPTTSATSAPATTPPPVVIIPLIPTAAVDGQLSSAVALPPTPYGAGPPPSGMTTIGACPNYDGQDAPKADVQAALEDAGATARTFTYTNSAGAAETVSISVPAVLMEAEAWQESGWQSQIVSCDGGVGTMQIMTGTAAWMNSHFGVDYDYQTLAGNTQLGSEYLEWLIAWFGETYYGDDFSLSNQGLLNDVIAAYNVGPGEVNPTAAGGGIPNTGYVASVEALEAEQPWNN
jgi:hypothetical protein